MKCKIPLILLIFFFYSFSVSAQVYISPDGDDRNSGTEESPLVTLNAARDLLRTSRIKDTVPKKPVIIIKDGVYTLKKTLVLTPEDSGTRADPFIVKAAQGARPVFSGGKRITGFTVNTDGIWQVWLSEYKNSKNRPGQLYSNGKRAVLARTPNKGFFKIREIRENILIKGNGRSPEKSQLEILFNKEAFQLLKQIPGEDQDLLRFKTFHKWDFTMRYPDSIDNSKYTVYSTGKGMKPWNPIKKDGRIIFENFKAALDEPGEWFLNNEGILYYYPKKGETPQNTEIIIPVTSSFIRIKGNASAGKYVENIHFNGITFRYSNYRSPPEGFEPNQAATVVPAAVQMTGARNIRFENFEISRTGQHAIWIKKGCSNNSIVNCYLHDLGGGGVYLGDTKASDDPEHTSHTRIENNIIQSGGREFPPAVGIWTGHSSDNTIIHNDIADFFYTGISAGWIWGYKPSTAKRNVITYNKIHHIGWDLLSDMAAVYTLGRSEGTRINNNVIHHVHAYSYGGWGLYPDEGTSFIEIKNNLVYSTKTGGFHQHYGMENTISNNIFAFAKYYQLQCTRVEDHLSFTFKNNIVIFDQGEVLNGAWKKIRINMDHNLYWNLKPGGKYSFAGKNFKKWQRTGHDTHSVIADPDFVYAELFNFKLKNTENIKKIGFKPFDYSQAGVFGSEEWKEKAKLPKETILKFDQAVKENMAKDIH